MKRILILFLGLILASNSFSQGLKKMKKLPVDTIVIDLFSDLWMKKPDDFKSKWYNRGLDISTMGNIPFSKVSKLSFAFGVGISIDNLYSNYTFNPSNNPSNSFSLINSTSIPTYHNSKLTLVYGDVPLEFRFKSKKDNQSGFNFTIGGKVGWLLDSHTKLFGSAEGRVKEHFVPDVQKNRYGITARIGYGKVYLFGYYSLTTLFSKTAIEMYPISIGISIIP